MCGLFVLGETIFVGDTPNLEESLSINWRFILHAIDNMKLFYFRELYQWVTES